MGVLKNILTGLPEAIRSFRSARLTLPTGAGFWRGRQFRAYHEVSGSNITEYLRFVATAPFHLQYQGLQAFAGDIRIAVMTGSTPSGTWTTSGMVQSKYRIGIDPVSTSSIETGGTFTGGTEREVLRAVAGGGGTGNAQQAIQSDTSIRGLPAGTYYIRIVMTGTCEGMYVLEYEDIDPDGR